MLKKNSQIELTIESVSGDGSGIGKYDGQVVFVPFSAVGDFLKVAIIKANKKYCIGKIIEILSPSSERQNPDCDSFRKCGGCVFRHINIQEEERIKTETVISAMKRIGHLDVDVIPCVTPSINSYRNKAQFPVSQDEKGIHCGFYASHSHRIVDSSIDCSTSPKVFKEIAEQIIAFMKNKGVSGYNEEALSGTVRHLYFRINSENKVMICIVCATPQLLSKETELSLINFLTNKFDCILSVFINYNPENTNVVLGKKFRLIYGQEYFEDELLSTRLKMSPDSFFQVNREGAEKVYSIGFSLLKGDYENVYDLYCGIGSIGITLFDEIKKGNVKINAKRLFGIEIVEEAVKCAKENAKINNIENAQFCSCDSVDIIKMDWFDKYPPSLVILDPPRKGTTTELLDFLSDRNVREILYISCDPATLARDMKYLYDKGYKSTAVYPVNLFTGTKHVESVVLLNK